MGGIVKKIVIPYILALYINVILLILSGSLSQYVLSIIGVIIVGIASIYLIVTSIVFKNIGHNPYKSVMLSKISLLPIYVFNFIIGMTILIVGALFVIPFNPNGDPIGTNMLIIFLYSVYITYPLSIVNIIMMFRLKENKSVKALHTILNLIPVLSMVSSIILTISNRKTEVEE